MSMWKRAISGLSFCKDYLWQIRQTPFEENVFCFIFIFFLILNSYQLHQTVERTLLDVHRGLGSSTLIDHKRA